MLLQTTRHFIFYKEILKSLFDKYLFKFLIDIPVSVDKASIDEGISFSCKNVFTSKVLRYTSPSGCGTFLAVKLEYSENGSLSSGDTKLFSISNC